MKSLFFYLTIALLILLLPLSSGAVRTVTVPYWFKNGTTLEYYANATPTKTYVWGGSVEYAPGKCVYSIGFQQVFVKFRVQRVTENTAYVNVTLLLLGSNALRRPFSYVNVIRPASCNPLPGPRINSTPFSPRGETLEDDLYKNLTVSGEYKLVLTNGSVYSLNGTYYGHTLLFGLYISNKGELPIVINGKPYLPETMRRVNITHVTYYRNFTPPNLFIKYPLVSLMTLEGNATGKTVLNFNPSNDVTSGMFGFIPDLEAVGVKALIAMDSLTNKYFEEISKEGAHFSISKYPAVGVMLYSLKVPKTAGTSSEAPSAIYEPRPSSRYWLVGVGGLTVVVTVGLLLWRRGRT